MDGESQKNKKFFGLKDRAQHFTFVLESGVVGIYVRRLAFRRKAQLILLQS